MKIIPMIFIYFSFALIGYQSKGEVYEDHWNDYFADRMFYPVAAF